VRIFSGEAEADQAKEEMTEKEEVYRRKGRGGNSLKF